MTMVFFLVMYLIEGVGTMALAVPLIKERVKPNHLSGFRVPETLNDEATWYRVNAVFGRWLFRLGALFTLLALGLYFLPGIHNARGAGVVGALIIYNMACTVVFLVGLFAAIAAGNRAIARRSV